MVQDRLLEEIKKKGQVFSEQAIEQQLEESTEAILRLSQIPVTEQELETQRNTSQETGGLFQQEKVSQGHFYVA